MPILSPLIGLDKIEIERIADEIGTFEISKLDDGGQCSTAFILKQKQTLKEF